MQLNHVEDRIKEFIIKHFPLARKVNLGWETQLLESGLVDSLGILELVSFLEMEFHIALTDEDLVPENFHSIATLALFVRGKLNGSLLGGSGPEPFPK